MWRLISNYLQGHPKCLKSATIAIPWKQKNKAPILRNETKKWNEEREWDYEHTHTHMVLIPEVLEEDGVTNGSENVNITEGVSDIWVERRSGGPHIHGFGFFDPSWNLEDKRVFYFILFYFIIISGSVFLNLGLCFCCSYSKHT